MSWELTAVMSIIILAPFAFFGVFWLFTKIINLIKVRRGYVGAEFIRSNRYLVTSISKPNSNYLSYAGKKYKFDPKKLFRRGSTPTMLYVEDRTEPIDPLVSKTGSKISTQRLSEVLIRFFNLGKISAMKQEKIMQILLIIAVAAAIGAVGFAFMNFQAMGVMEGRLAGAVSNVVKEEISKINITTPSTTTTSIPVLT